MRTVVITKEMIGDGFGWETWPGELDVRDFGADPTGVLDSTAAIQAAIDTASHTRHPGLVLLPPGDYLISSSLRIYEGISFGGMPDAGARWNRGGPEHRAVRIIWGGDNTSPAIFLGGTAETSALAWMLEGVYLHDFLLLPDAVAGLAGGATGAATDGQDGITINGSQAGTYPDVNRLQARDIIMQQVSVRNFGRNNYRLEGDVFDLRLYNCCGQRAGDDGFETLILAGAGINHPGQVHLSDCYMWNERADKWAIDLDAVSNWSIRGGGIAGAGDGLTGGSYGVIDGAVNFEATPGVDAKIGVRIMGQGVRVQASILNWITALQIGNNGVEVCDAWIFFGGIITGTTGLLVTAGGSRTGVFIEPTWGAITTKINNARSDTDGSNDVHFVSNKQGFTYFTNDATPDVFLRDRIGLTGTATVTDFDNEHEGQLLEVLLLSDTIDFTYDVGKLKLNGAVDWTTGLTGDSIWFISYGGIWYEINRHIITCQTYTETNVVPDRAFDATTVALPELAHVVGALIVDLRAKGIVK